MRFFKPTFWKIILTVLFVIVVVDIMNTCQPIIFPGVGLEGVSNPCGFLSNSLSSYTRIDLNVINNSDISFTMNHIAPELIFTFVFAYLFSCSVFYYGNKPDKQQKKKKHAPASNH